MFEVYWTITSFLLLTRTETFFDIQLNIKGKKNGMYQFSSVFTEHCFV